MPICEKLLIFLMNFDFSKFSTVGGAKTLPPSVPGGAAPVEILGYLFSFGFNLKMNNPPPRLRAGVQECFQSCLVLVVGFGVFL